MYAPRSHSGYLQIIGTDAARCYDAMLLVPRASASGEPTQRPGSSHVLARNDYTEVLEVPTDALIPVYPGDYPPEVWTYLQSDFVNDHKKRLPSRLFYGSAAWFYPDLRLLRRDHSMKSWRFRLDITSLS